jgi:hypothetical protein
LVQELAAGFLGRLTSLRPILVLLIAVLTGILTIPSTPAHAQDRAPRADTRIAIDLDHILSGEINRRGELVGLHHEPSAPKTIRVDGDLCFVEFRYTSPGDDDDVRTAEVRLIDPDSRRVVREKFSTCFPVAWDAARIEQAIREAFADARSRRGIEDNGRWEGRTAAGVRIGGYLTRDGDAIATAYPVYTPPRGRSRR